MFFAVVTYKVENDEHEYHWELNLSKCLTLDTSLLSAMNSAKVHFIEDHPEAISFKIKMEIREEEYIKTGDMQYQGF